MTCSGESVHAGSTSRIRTVSRCSLASANAWDNSRTGPQATGLAVVLGEACSIAAGTGWSRSVGRLVTCLPLSLPMRGVDPQADTMVSVITRGIRAFMARDWQRVRDAKDAYLSGSTRK